MAWNARDERKRRQHTEERRIRGVGKKGKNSEERRKEREIKIYDKKRRENRKNIPPLGKGRKERRKVKRQMQT